MEIKMNKEIRDYAETMFFGLSLRQFLFSALGCLLSVGIFFLLYRKYRQQKSKEKHPSVIKWVK